MKEPFLINPPKRLKGLSRRFESFPYRYNFLFNPTKLESVSKKRRKTMAKRRVKTRSSRKRHRPVLYGSGKKWSRGPHSLSRRAGISINPRRRTRRRVKRNSPLMIAGANPVRRRYRRNAPRHRVARYRRNPISGLGGPMDFGKNMPYIFTGALSATATAMVPSMLAPMLPAGFTGPPTRILLKFATAVGGAFVVDMVMPRRGHGAVWALVGSGIALADALQEYLLKPMGFISDYEVGDYEVEDYEDNEDMGAFPDTDVGMSAFPATGYQF